MIYPDFEAIPRGRYGCVLLDPPWSFLTYSKRSTVPHRGVEPYSTMSFAELKALPIADLCAEDAALFMWVIDSHLDQAFTLGRALGFRFTTRAFTWLKAKRNAYPVPGMGYWTRKQTEMCWMFSRGKPRRLSKGVEEVIYSPRRAHSQKPDEQYPRIERLVGGPRLELFAREEPPEGWDCWGLEAGHVTGNSLGLTRAGQALSADRRA